MLYSKNLKLRAIQIEDLKYLNEWHNDLDNKIMSQGYRLPVTLEQDEEWLKQKMGNTHGKELFLIVEERDNNIPIGRIQLTNIDYISGTAEWGFLIGDKTKRGKGYSVEAPHLLFGYAFNVLNIRKIYGYPIVFNKMTLRMHQKIGIVHEEGILKKQYYLNGEYHDVLILAIYREDYPDLFPSKL
jgi:RimJ/RimL family protein N-acetyltransferase